jgi:hypothetical protein
MTSTNVKAGTYDFHGSNGQKVGTVVINGNGDWSYVGHNQGSNSGRIRDDGTGSSQFVDHNNKVVGNWASGNKVTWSDADGHHAGTLKSR